MSTRQIHVFISHSWAYSDHYDTLSSWIFDENWSVGSASLDLHDYSVPKDDPIHKAPTVRELDDTICAKIARCHVVVIPTGMYATHSKWIKREIACAREHIKPILAVNPRGQERLSSVVSDAATKKVGWNKKSVIGGIWTLYNS